MRQDDVTLESVRRIAADMGMTRLTEEHEQQFLRAANAARARRASLKTDTLGPADEPAHVFRLTEDGK
jgi:hypothetical protein